MIVMYSKEGCDDRKTVEMNMVTAVEYKSKVESLGFDNVRIVESVNSNG